MPNETSNPLPLQPQEVQWIYKPCEPDFLFDDSFTEHNSNLQNIESTNASQTASSANQVVMGLIQQIALGNSLNTQLINSILSAVQSPLITDIDLIRKLLHLCMQSKTELSIQMVCLLLIQLIKNIKSSPILYQALIDMSIEMESFALSSQAAVREASQLYQMIKQQLH